jgi:uncharacterized membrane protein
MSLMIAGLALFLAVHLIPAVPAARPALVAGLGERRYKGVFSLAAAAGLALIVAGFAHWHPAERLFAPVAAAKSIAPAAMTLCFIFLAAANMRGHLRRAVGHPMLLGVLIWAGIHLLANGDLKGTLLFGAFLAYAVIDLVSVVLRRATKPFVPEVRFDVMAVVGGVVVAALVMTFHRIAFGVAVAPFGV